MNTENHGVSTANSPRARATRRSRVALHAPLVLVFLLGFATQVTAAEQPAEAQWDNMRWDTGVWAPVPEPASGALMASALFTLAALGRWGRRRSPESISAGPNLIQSSDGWKEYDDA